MRVLAIFDHPYTAAASDNRPHRRSFSAALLAAAIQGLATAGHTVDVIDLAADGFRPALSAEDLAAWRQRATNDPLVLDYQRRLGKADHVLFVYPTWWMSMPAATKGFLDRVLTKGFAFEEPRPGGPLRRRLHRLGGVTVLTPMTTPRGLYRTWFGSPGERILVRGTFRLIGIRRVKFYAYSAPAGKSLVQRQRMLAKTTRRFAALEAPARP